MDQTVIIDLSKIKSNQSAVLESIIAKANELGLNFRVDVISNRLVINCNASLKVSITNYISGIRDFNNNWIVGQQRTQRFTKRFIIYGFYKRSLTVADHTGLCNLVYAQLLAKSGFEFPITDLKINHFMSHFGILLSYNEQLSEWLTTQVNPSINIGSFNCVIYRFGHFKFCLKCSEDCVSTDLLCFRCGQSHDY